MSSLLGMVRSSIEVFARPGSTEPFDHAQPGASTALTIIGLVILGLVRSMVAFLRGTSIDGLIPIPVITIVFFYTLSALQYLLAKFFEGSGTFTVQSYLLALVFVTSEIVLIILRPVPVIGSLGALVMPLYAIFLDIYAIKSSHALDTEEAAVVILIPLLGGMVMIGLLTVMLQMGLVPQKH